MLSRFSEIGSEFWIEREPERFFTESDGVYCLSGRTAIDLILQNILQKRKVRSVAMPAWCCDSMLVPFEKHGVDVRFYDLGFTDFTDFTDIFYLTNYFGYKNTIPVETVSKIKDQGRIILYDRTHSFLMDDGDYCEVADYNFASIRKWMGVVGGAVVKGIEKPVLKDCMYASVKKIAMRDKFLYLMGEGSIQKGEFLAAFREFGHRLALDYENYAMDALSYTLYKQADLKKMKRQRRENAAYIHKYLKNVKFVYELTSDAVPLFVPILFESREQRDQMRKLLIAEQLYCPIHWPKPAEIPADFNVNEIYDCELSLLCDQRYNLTDMKKQIDTIMRLI